MASETTQEMLDRKVVAGDMTATETEALQAREEELRREWAEREKEEPGELVGTTKTHLYYSTANGKLCRAPIENGAPIYGAKTEYLGEGWAAALKLDGTDG